MEKAETATELSFNVVSFPEVFTLTQHFSVIGQISHAKPKGTWTGSRTEEQQT